MTSARAWARIGILLAVVMGATFGMGERRARADETPGRPATFALIIGSNRSVDTNVQPLKYADDDAARYQDLFRLLGARTYLLARLDENTERLHPQAASEASLPQRGALEKAVVQVIADIAQARERHIETELYFVYAGHGGVDEHGDGYITLEDLRVTGADLASLVARIPATRVHLIVDACASYFLAYSRGPGGERRSVRELKDVPQLASDPRVGLLLSTSSARESHEWDQYQAGVFSHEVRSALYGAADADGDGRVSYREVAAFVSRANAAIANERFRPDVHAKAPAGTDTLLDLRVALGRRLEVSGRHAAHYWLEDQQGVRLLDFHNGHDSVVRIVRPGPTGTVFLRSADGDAEYRVPAGPRAISLDDLAPARAAVASRGAAQEAFGELFARPFDESAVDTYREAPVDLRMQRDAVTPLPSASALSSRTVVGASVLGAGGLALGAAAILATSASTVSHNTSSSFSEASIAERNTRISAYNTAAIATASAGGAAVATGLLILLWPRAPKVSATPTAAGASFTFMTSF